MKNFIISIGRQLGSGGKEIAEKLGERLNINVYDKTLLEVAAKESGIDATVFETADEQENSGLFGGLFSIHGSIGEYMPMGGYMGNDKLFEIQSETIRNIADRENCIIVGRCAEYVLRDHPGMISIFKRLFDVEISPCFKNIVSNARRVLSKLCSLSIA